MIFIVEQPDPSIIKYCDFKLMRMQERGPDPADPYERCPSSVDIDEQELNQEVEPC